METINNSASSQSQLPIVFQSKQVLKEKIGFVLGTTEWLTVTQEMINDFAKATFDNQWIHIDLEKAKTNLPNGKTIAHGYLTMSLASQFLYQLINIENLISFVNYGINKARFINPVMSGSDIRMHATIANVEEQANGGIKLFFNCTIEIKDQEKPAFVAEIISLIF
jgi:acyl dehydratase